MTVTKLIISSVISAIDLLSVLTVTQFISPKFGSSNVESCDFNRVGGIKCPVLLSKRCCINSSLP
jgi:hypothetical protein